MDPRRSWGRTITTTVEHQQYVAGEGLCLRRFAGPAEQAAVRSAGLTSDRDKIVVAPGRPVSCGRESGTGSVVGAASESTCHHARIGEAQVCRSRSRSRGISAAPTGRPNDEGHSDRAWPSGTSHHFARQSNGAWSKVMSMPRPMVTAEVPSGNIRPTSRSLPSRGDEAIAVAARKPMTVAISAATTANRNETAMEANGSTPRPRPGRASSAPSLLQAVEHRPLPTSNDRVTSATIGVPTRTHVARLTTATNARSRGVRAMRGAVAPWSSGNGADGDDHDHDGQQTRLRTDQSRAANVAIVLASQSRPRASDLSGRRQQPHRTT